MNLMQLRQKSKKYININTSHLREKLHKSVQEEIQTNEVNKDRINLMYDHNLFRGKSNFLWMENKYY